MNTVNDRLRNQHLAIRQNQMKSCQQLTLELRETIAKANFRSDLSQKYYHFDCKEYEDFVKECKDNNIIINNKQITALKSSGAPNHINGVIMKYDVKKDVTDVELFWY